MKTLFLVDDKTLEIQQGDVHLVIRGEMSNSGILEMAQHYLDPRDYETVERIYKTFGGLAGIRIERDLGPDDYDPYA